MSRFTLCTLLCVSLLSACAGKLGGPAVQPGFDEAYSESVGFSGVAREPS